MLQISPQGRSATGWTVLQLVAVCLTPHMARLKSTRAKDRESAMALTLRVATTFVWQQKPWPRAAQDWPGTRPGARSASDSLNRVVLDIALDNRAVDTLHVQAKLDNMPGANWVPKPSLTNQAGSPALPGLAILVDLLRQKELLKQTFKHLRPVGIAGCYPAASTASYGMCNSGMPIYAKAHRQACSLWAPCRSGRSCSSCP